MRPDILALYRECSQIVLTMTRMKKEIWETPGIGMTQIHDVYTRANENIRLAGETQKLLLRLPRKPLPGDPGSSQTNDQE